MNVRLPRGFTLRVITVSRDHQAGFGPLFGEECLTMIKALTHVAIKVSDIERSVDFYCNKLGLSEQFRLENDGKPCLVYIKVAENQFIELFPGGQGAHKDSEAPGCVHFCLLVDDIQESFREITSRGVKSLNGEPTFGGDNAWQFWVADPDGNPFEFHQFTDESMQIRQV